MAQAREIKARVYDCLLKETKKFKLRKKPVYIGYKQTESKARSGLNFNFKAQSLTGLCIPKPEPLTLNDSVACVVL